MAAPVQQPRMIAAGVVAPAVAGEGIVSPDGRVTVPVARTNGS